MTNTKNKNVTNVKGITATNSVGSKPDQTIKPIQKQQSAQPVATPNQEIGDYVESTNPNYGKIYFA